MLGLSCVSDLNQINMHPQHSPEDVIRELQTVNKVMMFLGSVVAL